MSVLSRPAFRAPAAALAALTCAALLAGPASAESRTVTDATGDVLGGSLESDQPADPAPERTEGDVESLRAVHARHAVRLTLRLAQLTPVTGTETQDLTVHSFALRTDEGRRATLDLLANPGSTEVEKVWRSGRAHHCRGLRATVSYDEDLVRVVVPRRCLSSPRWVRVGGGTGILQGDRLYGDDASLDGTLRDDLALGQRIRRG